MGGAVGPNWAGDEVQKVVGRGGAVGGEQYSSTAVLVRYRVEYPVPQLAEPVTAGPGRL